MSVKSSFRVILKLRNQDPKFAGLYEGHNSFIGEQGLIFGAQWGAQEAFFDVVLPDERAERRTKESRNAYEKHGERLRRKVPT